jgi:hypothetical protein
MKAKVKYFDYDVNEVVEKTCEDFHYTTDEMFEFEFMPVDEPAKIYKHIVVRHPRIDIHYSGEYKELRLTVEGYQFTKDGWNLNKTTITIKEDEFKFHP